MCLKDTIKRRICGIVRIHLRLEKMNLFGSSTLVSALASLWFLAVVCSGSEDGGDDRKCVKEAIVEENSRLKVKLSVDCHVPIPLESDSNELIIVAERPKKDSCLSDSPRDNSVPISIGDADSCKLNIGWSKLAFNPTEKLLSSTEKDVELKFGSDSVTVKFDKIGKPTEDTFPARCDGIWKKKPGDETKYTTTLTIGKSDIFLKCDHFFLIFPEGVKYVEPKAEVKPESGSSMSLTVIAGITAGVLAIASLAGIACFCLCEKKEKEKMISAADMLMRRKKKKEKRSKKGKHGKHKKKKKPKKFNPYENPFEIKSKSEVTASKSTVDCTTEGRSAVSGATTSRA